MVQQRLEPTRAHYDPNQTPTRQAHKHFEAHELRRLPVVLSESAKAELDASSSEGRKFQQALSEMFGGLEHVKEVHVDCVPRSTYFPVGDEDRHSDGREHSILDITVVHQDDSIDPHIYHLNAISLLPTQGLPHTRGFNAMRTAKELVRLYPHKPGGRSVPPYAKKPDERGGE